jgi:hypothetical protein
VARTAIRFENRERHMSDTSNVARNLRERLSGSTEDRLGKALSELLENPLLTGALGRAFDAREKAVQAQEVAMGALNIPSAADIERLTRRLRSVSHRLEGIEDGVDRLDRALAPGAVEARLSAIEDELKRLSDRLDHDGRSRAAKPAPAKPAPKPRAAGAKAAAARRRPASAKPAARSRHAAAGPAVDAAERGDAGTGSRDG